MLSVIIPVYNEENSVLEIIEQVKSVPIQKEIVVVDDGSSDKTVTLLRDVTGIKLFIHNYNQGKGAAIRTALPHASGDIILIQDADLEYDPSDYPKLVAPFKDLKVIAVYGSRFKGKGRFLFLSRLANIFLTFITNALFGGKLTDMETCYKLIRKEAAVKLNLQAKRFEIEPEITAKLLRQHYRIVEVPIKYHGRSRGKKIGWRDGLIACWTLLKVYVS
ncbi:MAG: glycosyltransferase family 2 protein [candidate division WOR-3 bacterium]